MALNATIHWGLILRVDVPQLVSQDGWKHLLANARYPFNFDGEIFGLQSTMGAELRKFGFRGEEAGQEADFIDVNRGFNQDSTVVNWLERIDITPLVDDLKPFQAWKLKDSGVYDVATNDFRVVTKGTEIDWPPFVGKIH